jgi:hypothetical protein
MRMGRLAYLADGTPVNLPAAPAAVPMNQGGNAAQGRGLEFVYQTPIISSLAAGAASTVTIQYDNNSVFTWLRSTVVADLAGAAQTNSTIVVPLVTLQITDTGNGMSFMNAPIPLSAIAGTASLPFILPTPQFIQPNASFQFAFVNYSAATTYLNLRFQMHGFRTFQ